MRYKVDSLLDLSPDGCGLLIPVFKIEGSNLPFVQEMDENYEVFDMQPFVNVDHYEFCVPSDSISTDVGEHGVIAFRSHDETIFLGSFGDLIQYRDAHRDEISKRPMLDMQLARICGEQISLMHERWRKVGLQYLGEKDGLIWAASELTLAQRNSAIWRSIDSKKPKPLEESSPPELRSHSFEYLFTWLHRHPGARSWRQVWLRAFRLRPFDERIHILALSWLRSEMAESSYIADIKLILFAFLERLEREEIFDEDFSDVLTDYISERIEDVHETLFPSGFPRLIFKNLNPEQDPMTVIQLFVYYNERLEEDERFSEDLAYIWESFEGFIYRSTDDLEKAARILFEEEGDFSENEMPGLEALLGSKALKEIMDKREKQEALIRAYYS